MKIACVSDIHGMWGEINYPEADALVLAGDILHNYIDDRMGSCGQLNELKCLNSFFRASNFKHIILVPGNHDWVFATQPHMASSVLTDVTLLVDSGATIDGVKFYGSPWQPWFYDWAFNFPNPYPTRGGSPDKYRDAANLIWGKIPSDTDVLVTHGPSYGILDTTIDGRRVGCEYMRKRICDLNLKSHIFGHIHWSAGAVKLGDTQYINAAICNEKHRPVNKIQVIEV